MQPEEDTNVRILQQETLRNGAWRPSVTYSLVSAPGSQTTALCTVVAQEAFIIAVEERAGAVAWARSALGSRKNPEPGIRKLCYLHELRS